MIYICIMDPQLHLHAHLEFDRSCNRCSNCCVHIFRRKHRKTASDSDIHNTVHVRVQQEPDEQESIEMYLRVKRIINSRFGHLNIPESQMFEIVQMKANVRLYPHKMPTEIDLDKIAEAAERIADLVRESGIQDLGFRAAAED